jgi:hypothetical protein
MRTIFWLKTLKVRDLLKDLGADRKTKLEWIQGIKSIISEHNFLTAVPK